jgi:hypothetical protein
VRNAIISAPKATPSAETAKKHVAEAPALPNKGNGADRLTIDGIPEPFGKPDARPEMQIAEAKVDQNVDRIRQRLATDGKSQEEHIATPSLSFSLNLERTEVA